MAYGEFILNRALQLRRQAEDREFLAEQLKMINWITNRQSILPHTACMIRFSGLWHPMTERRLRRASGGDASGLGAQHSRYGQRKLKTPAQVRRKGEG